MKTGDGSRSGRSLFHRLSGRGIRDEGAIEEPLADRGALPSASVGQQALARLLEAAAGPATEEELSGEAAAVAAFVLAVNAAGPWSGRQGRFPGNRGTVRRAPVLVAGMAVAVGAVVGGTATAGVLPPRIQEIAHMAFGAPAPHHYGGGVPAPAPRHSPRSWQLSPGPVDGHRRGGGGPGATAKAAPSAAEPEHPKPGKADAPKPGKAKGHLKANGSQTHSKKDSQGQQNGQQQANAASAQSEGRGHQKAT